MHHCEWNLIYMNLFRVWTTENQKPGVFYADQCRSEPPVIGMGEFQADCTSAGPSLRGCREGTWPLCRTEAERRDAADGTKCVRGSVLSPVSRGGSALAYLHR